jgi:hypothetical protein
MTIILPCVLDNIYTEMAVQYVGFAPWAIWGALWVAYTVTWDGAYYLTSVSITCSSVFLYVLRAYIDEVVPGYFCPDITRWGFPNLEMAAIGSLFVYVVFFRWYYKMNVTYFQWFILAVVFLTPAIVHVTMAEVAFWKVALSAVYGIAWALLTCPFLWTAPNNFAYLFNLPFFYGWFGESILLRTDESRALFKRLRQECLDEERAHSSRLSTWLWGASSVLSSKFG